MSALKRQRQEHAMKTFRMISMLSSALMMLTVGCGPDASMSVGEQDAAGAQEQHMMMEEEAPGDSSAVRYYANGDYTYTKCYHEGAPGQYVAVNFKGDLTGWSQERLNEACDGALRHNNSRGIQH
jgi:hypothetical protein